MVNAGTDVVMAAGFGNTGHHRQHRLGPVQGLGTSPTAAPTITAPLRSCLVSRPFPHPRPGTWGVARP